MGLVDFFFYSQNRLKFFQVHIISQFFNISIILFDQKHVYLFNDYLFSGNCHKYFISLFSSLNIGLEHIISFISQFPFIKLQSLNSLKITPTPTPLPTTNPKPPKNAKNIHVTQQNPEPQQIIIIMLVAYKLGQILLIAILINLANSIEIELRNEQTCIDYIVDDAGSRKIFFFHYNHNMDNVNMVLYYKSVKEIWHQTGFGIEYKNYIEVQYKDAGNYTLCFIKKSAGVADVSFQILDEASRSNYAGKEQLARLTKRVSEFLMEIKKVGWTFKQVLQQHNSRKQTIAQQQNSYGYLLALKTVVMAVIIGVQIFVIKRIFK